MKEIDSKERNMTALLTQGYLSELQSGQNVGVISVKHSHYLLDLQKFRSGIVLTGSYWDLMD